MSWIWSGRRPAFEPMVDDKSDVIVERVGGRRGINANAMVAVRRVDNCKDWKLRAGRWLFIYSHRPPTFPVKAPGVDPSATIQKHRDMRLERDRASPRTIDKERGPIGWRPGFAGISRGSQSRITTKFLFWCQVQRVWLLRLAVNVPIASGASDQYTWLDKRISTA